MCNSHCPYEFSFTLYCTNVSELLKLTDIHPVGDNGPDLIRDHVISFLCTPRLRGRNSIYICHVAWLSLFYSQTLFLSKSVIFAMHSIDLEVFLKNFSKLYANDKFKHRQNLLFRKKIYRSGIVFDGSPLCCIRVFEVHIILANSNYEPGECEEIDWLAEVSLYNDICQRYSNVPSCHNNVILPLLWRERSAG